ncbi:low choriolytic enzyme-like [Limulus polyphemus]|uniref:Metalloendopeptidase n=1 Tax=Limulus polyphemus TaxID=6850 RepID=A0ABM1SBB7_LIMPO|nr:low choriolytic enzyme-like [Limulus polyphemus]
MLNNMAFGTLLWGVFVLEVVLCSKFDALYQEDKETPYGHLIQGDIMVPKGVAVRDRLAVKDERSKWSNGIVLYTIDSVYDDDEKKVIISALAEIEEQTCIQFVERKDEVAYIFITSKEGCWSNVGRLGEKQIVSLQRDTCVHKGVVMHEIMHAIGFEHEHNRPDRNEYVIVIWENILPSNYFQFDIVYAFEFDTFGEPYDYKSVMHYDYKAFSKGSGPTLLPKKSSIQATELGEALTNDMLTEKDIKKLNKYYCDVKTTN